jgi:hypothetical protein
MKCGCSCRLVLQIWEQYPLPANQGVIHKIIIFVPFVLLQLTDPQNRGRPRSLVVCLIQTINPFFLERDITCLNSIISQAATDAWSVRADLSF